MTAEQLVGLDALRLRWDSVVACGEQLAVCRWGKLWYLVDRISGLSLGPNGGRLDMLAEGRRRIANGDYR